MSSSVSFAPTAESTEPSQITDGGEGGEITRPDSIDLETEAEDEEEVMEQPEEPRDITDVRKVKVCQDMIMDMLRVVGMGLMSSDPKYVKNWCRHLLQMIADLIWTHTDDASRDLVVGKIFEAWNTSAKAHENYAILMTQEHDYHSQVARSLHQNGWEAEAKKEDRKAARRASRVVRANRLAHIWRKTIDEMRRLGGR
jgi:hypothetical protein